MARGEDDRLMERLGYVFRDPLLLDRALTHSSAVPELRTARGEDIAFAASVVQDNERLEFLGDAVLELLTSEYLLLNYPEWTEGQLSKSRARIVNAHSLEIAARGLHLGEHLRLGDGDRISESDRKSALQEFLQAKGDQPAEYRLAGETGPDHQKTFRVEVWVKGEFMSSAEGTTKKEAEQKAARIALDKLLSAETRQGEEVGPNAG